MLKTSKLPPPHIRQNKASDASESNAQKYLRRKFGDFPVQWLPLGEVAEIGTGSSNRQDEVEDGKYPFYVRSKNVLRSATFQFDEIAIIIPGEGGIGEIFHYVEGKYALHQRAYRISIHNSNLSTRFLYFYMTSHFKGYIINKSVGATATSIRKPMLENFIIPIPPMEVQNEVVEILDKFTALLAELKAELKARKLQYEYYRDQLLSFPDDDPNVQWLPLGEIGDVKMCKRILKHQTSIEGDVPFFKIGTFGSVPDSYISRSIFDELKNKYSYPQKGYILISTSGTIGKRVIFDGNDAYFQDSNIVWLDNDESIVLNKYLFYMYEIIEWNISKGGTIQRLYNNDIKRTIIPIPPMEEQERIVGILDKFDTLTNSLTEGIPKEIEMRQMQYEYYRDALLSF